jgi:hypothetical protein
VKKEDLNSSETPQKHEAIVGFRHRRNTAMTPRTCHSSPSKPSENTAQHAREIPQAVTKASATMPDLRALVPHNDRKEHCTHPAQPAKRWSSRICYRKNQSVRVLYSQSKDEKSAARQDEAGIFFLKKNQTAETAAAFAWRWWCFNLGREKRSAETAL